MSLANTVWASEIPVPPPVRDWLAQLFATVDSQSPDSGDSLAALYAPDATVYGLHGKAEGSEAIRQSRKAAWDTIKSRKHEVLQVYAGKQDYSDLMLLGRLTAELKNGNEVVTEFIAQIRFQGDTSKNPQGTLYKVWGDSAPWIKAMQAGDA